MAVAKLAAMKPSSVVHSDPEILGGTPVFVGTRVPVQALIDYIEGGHTLEKFLDDFPSVPRDLAIAPAPRSSSTGRNCAAVCGPA